MPDVVLVVPPVASAALPILGPSVLAAALRRAGIPCEVRYSNLEMAARIGYDRYRRFALSCTRMHGEMLFHEAAWGDPIVLHVDDFDARSDAVTRADFDRALAEVPALIEDEADAIAAGAPRVVGFSSVFQQTVASVALARAVRRRLPDATLLLGGANAAQPMAAGIAAATDAFDLVVAGEAELELPGLVRRLLAGDAPPGPVYECDPVHRLDDAPTPVFEDYYAQAAPRIEAGRLPRGLPVALPFESSRGCWWGALSHCTFCGINGTQIAERAKSPERVLEEIEALVERYGARELRASDDLLPIRVQREVLPELAARQAGRTEPLSFFYEVKASLKRSHLQLLAAAGVTQVQAGIESLSTATLERIGKGTTGPMNLVFLRECRAADVDPLWNWMVGFPGDRREDYEATLQLVPLLEHLRPPVALAPVRVDRYSPYFRDPGRYGVSDVRPLPGMERAWPVGAPIADIAYHFAAELPSPYRRDKVLGRRVGAAVDTWNAAWLAPGGPPVLIGEALEDGGLRVTDTRRSAVLREVTLGAGAADLLRRLERPTPVDRVEADADPAALGDLLFRGFVVQHEAVCLSVVVRPGAVI